MIFSNTHKRIDIVRMTSTSQTVQKFLFEVLTTLEFWNIYEVISWKRFLDLCYYVFLKQLFGRLSIYSILLTFYLFQKTIAGRGIKTCFSNVSTLTFQAPYNKIRSYQLKRINKTNSPDIVWEKYLQISLYNDLIYYCSGPPHFMCNPHKKHKKLPTSKQNSKEGW